MVDYERGLACLTSLIAGDHEADIEMNEDTTRFRRIDRILTECLGWRTDDITTEPYLEGDFRDYVLGNPQCDVVVEAKRIGHHFELPAGSDTDRIIKVSTVRAYSESNKAAVDQVLKYAQRAGIPIAVLCNGEQLIAFLGSRQDGIPPTDGRALVFHSVLDMQRDFPTLWESLSPPGIDSGILKRRLARRGRGAPPPDRLSSRILNYPGFKTRSELETDVRILADLFLEDVIHEESVSDDFLRYCYCTSGALSSYALVSKEILRSRYASVAQQAASVQNVRDKKGASDKLSGDLLSSALTRRPLILLGDVGVGKTIFLKHFLRIDAVDILRESIVFYIDFLKESSVSVRDDIREFLVSSMEQELDEKHGIDIWESSFVRAVYNKEINRFKKGIWGDLEGADSSEFTKHERAMLAEQLANRYEHLRRSVEHIRGTQSKQRRQFVLVLDNIDHHESEFQERVFVAGQAFSEKWPFAVFMSLRPDTFYSSRKSGSLTAYQPRIFTVEPPRTDLVISKRLDFAKSQLEATGRLESFPQGLTIDSANLVAYLDVLIEAFRHNDRLKELVDNLSSGNVRQALDFVTKYVGSGYVSTRKILEVHRAGGLYTLPIHEFMRSILNGEYAYYDPHKSAIANLFDITTNDGKEHFALPILLAACQSTGESLQDGYVEEALLFEHLQELGFSIEQIEAQLNRGVEKKLLMTTQRRRGQGSVRVTGAGGYMHKRMVGMFTYVDAMIVDTPIVDLHVRGRIHDVHSIQDRLERGRIFCDYLDQQWIFGEGSTTFSWPAASADLRHDMDLADARAQRKNQNGSLTRSARLP